LFGRLLVFVRVVSVGFCFRKKDGQTNQQTDDKEKQEEPTNRPIEQQTKKETRNKAT